MNVGSPLSDSNQQQPKLELHTWETYPGRSQLKATVLSLHTRRADSIVTCLRPFLSICHMPTTVPKELTAAGSSATSKAVRLSLNPANSRIAGV